MPTFSLIRTFVRPADDTTSRITDLALGTGVQRDVLYSTTRYDGQIDSWDIADAALLPSNSAAFDIGPLAGNTPTLTLIDDQILSGGGPAGALTLRPVFADGSFGTATPLTGTQTLNGPVVAPTAVTTGNGNTSLYAGLATGPGLVQITLDNSGAVISITQIATDQITALTSATLASTSFIFTTSGDDNGLRAWEINDAGGLTLRDTLSPDTGLRVADPTALATVQIAGVDYLILAAAGSSSVSVIAANALGELTVVDHVIDDRNTRFDGATALATATYQGQTWVFVGGG